MIHIYFEKRSELFHAHILVELTRVFAGEIM